jgi:hypothetical protein
MKAMKVPISVCPTPQIRSGQISLVNAGITAHIFFVKILGKT